MPRPKKFKIVEREPRVARLDMRGYVQRIHTAYAAATTDKERAGVRAALTHSIVGRAELRRVIG